MSVSVDDAFLKKIEEVKSDTVPQYSEVGLDQDFEGMVDDYAELTAQIKELEGKKDALAQDISALMEASGCLRCFAAGNKVAFVATRRESLDRLALIELGVPKSAIESATRVSVAVSIRLSKIKKQ